MATSSRPTAGSRRPNFGFNGKGTGVRANTSPQPAWSKPGKGHPASSDTEYAPEQVEFLKAAELYRERKHKPFLGACDYLTVVLELGYRKP